MDTTKLDVPYFFEARTRNPNTLEAQGADTPPTYRVYENGVYMSISGSMTLNDASNSVGWYIASITPTLVAGFEYNKKYTIQVTATVNGFTDFKSVEFLVEADVDLSELPTAAEIRAEMDANSAKLQRLDVTLSTRAAGSDAALILQGVEIIQEDTTSILEDTSTTLPEAIEDVDTGGGGVTIPVNQVVVPAARAWVLTRKGTALVGTLPIAAYVDDPNLYAIDFSADLPTNGTLVDFLEVTIIEGDGDGLEFDTDSADTFGVDKARAILRIEAAEPGDYVIEARVRYSDNVGGGTPRARVRLHVDE